MIERIAIIGAGNGGKAAAVDLTLQGKKVRLFDFPEFKDALDELKPSRTLTATGAVSGEAVLECITADLAEAVEGADTIMVCTQALAHERVAQALAPHVKPEHVVLFNPGSTGGSLQCAHIFRQSGVKNPPVLGETSTLTYGTRAKGAHVHVAVKAKRVLYGLLPAAAMPRVGPDLESLYPGLVRGKSVLEAGPKQRQPGDPSAHHGLQRRSDRNAGAADEILQGRGIAVRCGADTQIGQRADGRAAGAGLPRPVRTAHERAAGATRPVKIISNAIARGRDSSNSPAPIR